MKGFFDEVIWDKLSKENIEGEILWARHPLGDKSEKVIAALDPSRARHFLIKTHFDDTVFRNYKCSGIEICGQSYAFQNQEIIEFIDIKCIDQNCHTIFNAFGDELFILLDQNPSDPAAAVLEALDKWKSFWENKNRGGLSREKKIGLFVELWFMQFWLFPHNNIKEILDGWRGPFGERHDFEFPKVSIECKGTASQRGLVHLVNGIDQLSPSGNKKLYLFSMKLREEASSENTLLNLILKIKATLKKNNTQFKMFEKALEKYGYDQFHQDDHSEHGFHVLSESLYIVESSFPRLTPLILKNINLNGIQNITYEINLEVSPECLVASAPIKFSI